MIKFILLNVFYFSVSASLLIALIAFVFIQNKEKKSQIYIEQNDIEQSLEPIAFLPQISLEDIYQENSFTFEVIIHNTGNMLC